jgi:uncharacterized membrane protein
MCPEPNNDNLDDDEDDLPTLEEVDNDNEEEDDDDDEGSGEEDSDAEDNKDEVDKAFDSLTEEERGQLLDNTVAVCTTLDKVRFVLTTWITLSLTGSIMKIHKLLFAIVHSTTITLPVWRAACVTHGQRVHLTPRDVKTCWNSTYDMLMVAFDYRIVIDNVTGNKTLKLRQYELDDGDWEVVKDLLRVLKVSLFPRCHTWKTQTSLLDVQGCHTVFLSR